MKPGIWYSAEGLCRKFDVRKFITIDDFRKDR